jgi:dolichyl-phosphate-mannose-protein mannosyltransferase
MATDPPSVVPQADVPKAAGDAKSVGKDDGKVTPQPAGAAQEEARVVGKEEKIEYRDQDGNLLDPAEVSALAEEGKVTFKTKYETRTRMVDADGNEIGDSDELAPRHPDVEGQNPDTKGIPEKDGKSQPADAKIKSIGSDSRREAGKPKPGSEANEATGKSSST